MHLSREARCLERSADNHRRWTDPCVSECPACPIARSCSRKGPLLCSGTMWNRREIPRKNCSEASTRGEGHNRDSSDSVGWSSEAVREPKLKIRDLRQIGGEQSAGNGHPVGRAPCSLSTSRRTEWPRRRKDAGEFIAREGVLGVGRHSPKSKEHECQTENGTSRRRKSGFHTASSIKRHVSWQTNTWNS